MVNGNLLKWGCFNKHNILLFSFGDKMGIKQKVIKKQLKRLGIDISHPKQVTFRTLHDLIQHSVPNIISKKEMERFLEDEINQLE